MTLLDDTPPERRRVLMVLTEEAARLARRDPDLQDLLDNPEAMLLTIPPAHTKAPPGSVLDRLRQSNRLRPGALLVQSPFDVNHYEAADRALADFAVAKFMLLTRLCSLLGATKVTTEHVNSERRKTTTKGKAAGKGKVADAHATLDHDLVDSVKSRLQLTDEFKGGPPQIDAARAFLRERSLEYDEELSSLVALREADNSLSSRQISISLTRDSTENLKIAAKFTALKIVTVNAEFEHQVEEQLEVSVTASVTF